MQGDTMSERETQQGDRETGTCHICGQVFPTQEELSKHLMDAHADDGLSDTSDEP
jgi:Zinc finger, C2H2 type